MATRNELTLQAPVIVVAVVMLSPSIIAVRP